MPGFDLHTHTTFSDGVRTVEQNVAAAVAAGLEGLGVTDHDTTDHHAPALAAAEGTGLEVVPGTEFSAEMDGSSVHVLGFWVTDGPGPLADEMDRLRNERVHRARGIVEKFNALGVPVTYERVAELAGDAPVGRPHIAAAVLETGAVATRQQVFDEYLADGGPAYVPKHAVDPVRAVELVVGAGGVAVVAHPGLFGARVGTLEEGLPAATIEAMAAAGMAGVEADHPAHAPEVREHYRDLARGLGLVVTAGSDFHGTPEEPHPIGAATTTRRALERLREHRA